MSRRYTAIAVVLLLTCFAVAAITSMRQKSPACDEVSHHIATGYSFLITRDFRLNSTSPPLIEELAALPLLRLRPKLPLDHPSWDKIDRTSFGFQFLYRYNNNADQLVFWSRIPMVILSVLGGLLVFIFARDLYGQKAGLLAMFLYVFSPNILAYSGLVTGDIGVSFFILLAIYRFYKFIRKPKPKNILLAGITLGLAEASKVSALLLLPVFIAVCLCKALSDKRRGYILSAIAIIAIGYAVVFASYFGEVKPLLKDNIDVQEKIDYIKKGIDKILPQNNQALKKKAVDFALKRPIPFATYIMNVLSSTNMLFRERLFEVFLLGRYSKTGWWYYYPVVFILKTPIPTLILIILAMLSFIRVRPSNIWGERIGLLFLAGFIAVSLLTKLQLSVRYLLPIYPLLFIYISKLMNVQIRKQALLNMLIAALSIWYVTESLSIYPHYLSYFNRFAGGPDNGWRYLRDANIDYGQDLPALARYLKENKIERVNLLYFGTAEPAYYGISSQILTEKEKKRPAKEVYAISVNYIDSCEWTKWTKPSAKAGYSIFIYDFRNG